MDFSILSSALQVATSAGEIVITENEPLSGLYCLESGEVEI
jgi:CRP-like cAMP-binding protein